MKVRPLQIKCYDKSFFACLGFCTDPEISRDDFENLCSAFTVLCTESVKELLKDIFVNV